MKQKDLELPVGKRGAKYRFFEMLPGLLSYGMILLLIVLSIFSPVLAAVYLLLVVISTLVKAVGVAVRTIQGHELLKKAMRIDWARRLDELEDPKKNYERLAGTHSTGYAYEKHLENLKMLAAAEPGEFPKPSEIYHGVIVTMYNESYEVLAPTIESVRLTTFPNERIILILAYEERGGQTAEETAKRLEKKFGKYFKDFLLIKHPDGLKNEVIGKGGNITYAGKALWRYVEASEIKLEQVIVTMLDSDNRPHESYFDQVAYEYIVHEDRQHLSYQPVSLFMHNIWDVPAPMRVIAVGNSFWNIYDQVMIRPSMRKWFVDNSLKIVVKIQEHSLVDKFRHPRKDISDHLPIVFEIKEENI